MKRVLVLLAAVLTASTVLAVTAITASAVSFDESDVYTFADETDVGDSKLLRGNGKITVILKTTELEPGPHTMWWVIWDNPGACENHPDPCGTDWDFENYDVVGLDIGWATGRMIGNNGKGTFVASLREGQDLTGFPSEFGITTDQGFSDASSVEVHPVIRSHGPKIPGLVSDQLHTFNGGCPADPPGYGATGPNVCEDVQFGIHQ